MAMQMSYQKTVNLEPLRRNSVSEVVTKPLKPVGDGSETVVEVAEEVEETVVDVAVPGRH